MKRREFLIAAGATAGAATIATALPMPTFAAPAVSAPVLTAEKLPPHPFLSMQVRDKVQCLRAGWQPFEPTFPVDTSPLSAQDIARFYSGNETGLKPSGKLTLEIMKFDPEVPVINVSEAENLFLAWATVSPTVVDGERIVWTKRLWDIGWSYWDEGMSPIAILINRGANLIATRTRRGAGNLVLMHPDMVGLAFDPADPVLFVRSSEQQTFGLWTKAGTLISSMDVWTSEKMRRDTILVLYKGAAEIDAAAFVTRHPQSGDLHLTIPKRWGADRVVLGDSGDYVHAIRIENLPQAA